MTDMHIEKRIRWVMSSNGDASATHKISMLDLQLNDKAGLVYTTERGGCLENLCSMSL